MCISDTEKKNKARKKAAEIVGVLASVCSSSSTCFDDLITKLVQNLTVLFH